MNTRGRSGQNSANPTSNQGDDLLDYDTLGQTPPNQLIDEIRAMQAHLTEQTAAMQAQATLLTQQSTRLAANERELERLHEERESRRPRSMERSVRYNLKAKSPDPYYGKDHKTLFEFTRQCEAVFNTSGMPETEQDRRIAYAGSYLRDTPSDNWHEILSRGGHLNLTWKEFKKNLMNQLGSTEVFKDRTWMQYHHAQQRPNDTVQSFAAYLQRLRTILADADPEHPITEEQMVQKLRTGVIPIIRNSLALGHRHPATIAEFISDAQLAEGAAVLHHQQVEATPSGSKVPRLLTIRAAENHIQLIIAEVEAEEVIEVVTTEEAIEAEEAEAAGMRLRLVLARRRPIAMPFR